MSNESKLKPVPKNLDLMGSVPAGGAIAIGALAYLRVGGVAGAFLFGFGLFLVCTLNWPLVTGRMAFMYDYEPLYFFLIPIWLLGNVTGAMAIAALAQGAGVVPDYSIATAKMELSFPVLFVRGMLCEIFIFIAVRGYRRFDAPLIRCLFIFFGVAMFVLCGGEHCVADAFYLFACPSDVASGGQAFGRVGIVFLGNLVGAMDCLGLLNMMHAERL